MDFFTFCFAVLRKHFMLINNNKQLERSKFIFYYPAKVKKIMVKCQLLGAFKVMLKVKKKHRKQFKLK